MKRIRVGIVVSTTAIPARHIRSSAGFFLRPPDLFDGEDAEKSSQYLSKSSPYRAHDSHIRSSAQAGIRKVFQFP